MGTEAARGGGLDDQQTHEQSSLSRRFLSWMNRIQIPPLKHAASGQLLVGTSGSLGPTASTTIFPASSRSRKRSAGLKEKHRRGWQSGATRPKPHLCRDRILACRPRSIIGPDCGRDCERPGLVGSLRRFNSAAVDRSADSSRSPLMRSDCPESKVERPSYATATRAPPSVKQNFVPTRRNIVPI